MRGTFRVATGISLVLLAGCSQGPGFFAPLERKPASTSLVQLSAHTVVTGKSIRLDVNYDQATIDRITDLRIQLLDDSDASAARLDRQWSSERDRNGIELVLPPLPAGPYTIVITAMADETQLARSQQRIFVVTDNPAITRLFVEPPAFGLGLPARAVGTVAWERGQRPYLRWKFGDRVLSQGYVTTAEVVVSVPPPQSLGAFPITLELFPWGPDEGLDTAIQATVSSTITVVVDEPANIDSVEAWSARYATAYRLAADLLPTKRTDSAPRLRTVGEPTALVILGVVGYALPIGAGITIPSDAVPERGPLELAAQVAVGDRFSGTIVGVAAVDGTWSVEFVSDPANDYALVLTSGRDTKRRPVALDPLDDDRLVQVVLRLSQVDGRIGVALVVDAVIVAEVEQPVSATIDVERFGYVGRPSALGSESAEPVTTARDRATLPAGTIFVNEIASRPGAVWHGAAGRFLAGVVVAQTGHFPDLIASDRATLTDRARLWFAVDTAETRVVVAPVGSDRVVVRADPANTTATPRAVYELTYQRDRGVRTLQFDDTELSLPPGSDLAIQTDLTFALVADGTH